MYQRLPKVFYQGRTVTFRELAKLTSIPYDLLRIRYLRGARGEELLSPAKESSSRLYLTYQGKTQSLRAWAKELNLHYETLRQRIVRGDPTAGLDGAELVTKDTVHIKRGNGGGRKNISASLRKLSEQYDIPYDILHARYYRGWRGEALIKPVGDNAKHHLTYQGKTQSLRDWARELNIPYATALARLHRGATDPAEILKEPQENTEVLHIKPKYPTFKPV